MFTVQRVDGIGVFCNFPESDVSRLRVGLRASIKPYGWEKPITGKVTRFEGRLDPQTRNMGTEIDLPNAGGCFVPGCTRRLPSKPSFTPMRSRAPALGTLVKTVPHA